MGNVQHSPELPQENKNVMRTKSSQNTLEQKPKKPFHRTVWHRKVVDVNVTCYHNKQSSNS